MPQPVVLITGAARRIGASISRHLHQRGYRLVLHFHHSEALARELADSLNHERPDSVHLLQQDLTRLDELNALADRALGCFGRLDALVNNASAFYPTAMGEITPAQWLELSATNAAAPLLLSQALLPALKKQRGAIVNMVDIHAKNGLQHHLPYSMAKNALATLTRGLAAELAPEVRVNGIAPGAIIWPEHELDEQQKQTVLKSVPMGRLGEPEEIAETVAFLLEGPAYLTGQIIALDGGRTCRSLPEA
ncbi:MULTISPECIES: pteridine reductase [Oceanimonas]|uniref:Pteridine reductase n=1 Tax=Oceanimonas doudoroffii TaxID=84158 RepID=A0A233RGM3_9GAMM|nr:MULTISPECIES: pteridine reductase [Oceanimonas]NHI00863.1 3-oxoacyl-[acyl-carrier-protein] reductase FabG [Oceanimonas sp. MB9]OXY82531.1 pteridine reductase [Oceanimonas doudoroffii]